MKAIIYAFSVLMICLTLTAATNKNIDNEKLIILEVASSTVDLNQLEESVEILSERLTLFGLTSFSVTADEGNNQIYVMVPENCGMKYVEKILTAKGKFNFYETYTYDEFLKQVGEDNQIFELITQDNIWRPWLGIGPVENVDKIIESFNTIKDDRVRLIGQLEYDDKGFCVYGLRVNEEGNSLLSKQHIERMNLKKSESSEGYLLELMFEQETIEIWRDATRRNIGKPIVMLLDNKIVSSPKVSAEISSGLCEISGNIDKQECEYLLSIINTKTLPLVLKIVE
jgi:preprotein translocase subunit SecD